MKLAGLNPTETAAIVDLIQRINEDGVSILLIEHNMRAVMTLSHRIAVLNFDEKIVEGSPAAVANLELGARTRAARARRAESPAGVFDVFPRLRERREPSAGTLSGGEQQTCAIGRGLMACPRLLMLDEPSLGLAPIFDDLGRINAQGLTILLVEQNVLRSLQLAHRGYVLENGRVIRSGAGPELLASGHIKQAYLGL